MCDLLCFKLVTGSVLIAIFPTLLVGHIKQLSLLGDYFCNIPGSYFFINIVTFKWSRKYNNYKFWAHEWPSKDVLYLQLEIVNSVEMRHWEGRPLGSATGAATLGPALWGGPTVNGLSRFAIHLFVIPCIKKW